jgi:hypothetical protein
MGVPATGLGGVVGRGDGLPVAAGEPAGELAGGAVGLGAIVPGTVGAGC